jgi:hypothetical protein
LFRPPVETPQVRNRFDDLNSALRYYILQVAASARPDDTASMAPAERLLSPITRYEAPARNKAVKPVPAAGAGPTPAPGAAKPA